MHEDSTESRMLMHLPVFTDSVAMTQFIYILKLSKIHSNEWLNFFYAKLTREKPNIVSTSWSLLSPCGHFYHCTKKWNYNAVLVQSSLQANLHSNAQHILFYNYNFETSCVKY